MLLLRFQSTLPVRGATRTRRRPPRRLFISIHAPREGSDRDTQRVQLRRVISIHALREGSDVGNQIHIWTYIISIHAPREGSDSICLDCRNSPVLIFQSTLPVRGATILLVKIVQIEGFQSTLPVRGATLEALTAENAELFQSTLPVRGATADNGCAVLQIVISIHAPREGSDASAERGPTLLWYFNPRSP